MHLSVDYIGLAQHYGLKTEVLNLTSDVDVSFLSRELIIGEKRYQKIMTQACRLWNTKNSLYGDKAVVKIPKISTNS